MEAAVVPQDYCVVVKAWHNVQPQQGTMMALLELRLTHTSILH